MGSAQWIGFAVRPTKSSNLSSQLKDLVNTNDHSGMSRLERRAIGQQHEAVREGRRALRERPAHTFVHRDRYCELLISSKNLIRCDEPLVGVRGLLDVSSDERYLIEQEELFSRSY